MKSKSKNQHAGTHSAHRGICGQRAPAFPACARCPSREAHRQSSSRTCEKQQRTSFAEPWLTRAGPPRRNFVSSGTPSARDAAPPPESPALPSLRFGKVRRSQPPHPSRDRRSAPVPPPHQPALALLWPFGEKNPRLNPLHLRIGVGRRAPVRVLGHGDQPLSSPLFSNHREQPKARLA